MKYQLLCGLIPIIAITMVLTEAIGQMQRNDNPVALDLRVWPIGDNIFICRAENKSDAPVRLQEARVLFNNSNSFAFRRLDDPYRVNNIMGSIRSFREEPPPLIIMPKQPYIREVNNNEDLIWLKTALGDRYSSIYWYLGSFESAIIHVAYNSPGAGVAPAVVASRDLTARPILAFIFSQKNNHEMGFIFLNGTGEDVAVVRPLTQASRIIATSPAIKYTRELIIPASAPERVVVEAGKVGEWRLPWQTVLNLIPKEDLERIKAAGGDLDLVWKVGEYRSDPLPISLADPEARKPVSP